MSGWRMDGVYYRISDAAQYIPDREIRSMAMDFSALMYECERYVDGDTSKKDWQKALATFKNKWFGKRDERLKGIVEDAVLELRQELIDMIGGDK